MHHPIKKTHFFKPYSIHQFLTKKTKNYKNKKNRVFEYIHQEDNYWGTNLIQRDYSEALDSDQANSWGVDFPIEEPQNPGRKDNFGYHRVWRRDHGGDGGGDGIQRRSKRGRRLQAPYLPSLQHCGFAWFEIRVNELNDWFVKSLIEFRFGGGNVSSSFPCCMRNMLQDIIIFVFVLLKIKQK